MPELPEVEVTRRGISNVLLNAKIIKIIHDDKKLREPYAENIQDIEGGIIYAVDRRAKYIIVRTDKGSLILHLGMSGHLHISSETTLQLHDHFELVLDNGKNVILNDTRRFGLVLYIPAGDEPLEDHHLKNLGPEPFEENFNAQYLLSKFKGKKKTIKQILMDGAIVVGVGNIYASEILFACKILPTRLASSIKEQEAELIVDHTRRILKESILRGGTTIRDFEGADGKKGYFVQNLFVYGHEGKPCKICGSTIEMVTLGQRSTYYCPKCQK